MSDEPPPTLSSDAHAADSSRTSGEGERRPSVPLDAEVALWLSMLLFVPGLFAPFMTLERLAVFQDTVSLARTLGLLWADGKLVLWAVVFLFSVLVPVLKLFLEAVLCFIPERARAYSAAVDRLAHFLSQFSMAEIFVAAIIVTTIKLDVLADVRLHAGVYLLLGSVLTGLWASWRVGGKGLKV